MFDETVTTYEIRGGIPHALRKMQAGESVRVAFIGGSVTYGGAASDIETHSWRSLTCRHLETMFPNARFEFVNGAVSGTNSTYGAYRMEGHLFSRGPVDLIFVEFAVNDQEQRTDSIRAMEGIVRHARALHPDVDLIFIYCANRRGIEAYQNGTVPKNIAHHDEVARHYGLPCVNFCEQLSHMADLENFNWTALYADDVHPTNKGHALYASWLKQFLDQVSQTPVAESPQVQSPPVPLDPWNYEYGQLFSPERYAANVHGWTVDPAFRSDRVDNWTPPLRLFVSDRPGDMFELTFIGTAVGAVLLVGMDFGLIDYSIDTGDWKTFDPFDEYAERFHRIRTVLFQDDLEPGEHHLTVRVSETKHPKSTGHAVRLLNLMVNGQMKSTANEGE